MEHVNVGGVQDYIRTLDMQTLLAIAGEIQPRVLWNRVDEQAMITKPNERYVVSSDWFLRPYCEDDMAAWTDNVLQVSNALYSMADELKREYRGIKLLCEVNDWTNETLARVLTSYLFTYAAMDDIHGWLKR